MAPEGGSEPGGGTPQDSRVPPGGSRRTWESPALSSHAAGSRQLAQPRARPLPSASHHTRGPTRAPRPKPPVHTSTLPSRRLRSALHALLPCATCRGHIAKGLRRLLPCMQPPSELTAQKHRSHLLMSFRFAKAGRCPHSCPAQRSNDPCPSRVDRSEAAHSQPGGCLHLHQGPQPGGKTWTQGSVPRSIQAGVPPPHGAVCHTRPLCPLWPVGIWLSGHDRP